MKFDIDACICTAPQYWYMYTFRVQKKFSSAYPAYPYPWTLDRCVDGSHFFLEARVWRAPPAPPSKHATATSVIAFNNSFLKRSSGTPWVGTSSSRYNTFTQISTVSFSGTSINRLLMSNEHMKVSEIFAQLSENSSSFSQNAKVSLTVNVEYLLTTGCRISASHLASSCWGELIIERMGLSGMSALCILGMLYILGRVEPRGLIRL